MSTQGVLEEKVFNPYEKTPNISIICTPEREEYFRGIGWTKFTAEYDALFTLDFHAELEVDTETTGLRTFLVEKLWCIQIGIPGYQFIFDLEGGIDIKILKRMLESKLLYFHNAAFDLPYLYKHGIVPNRIYDTLAAEWELTRGLKPMPKRTLGALAKKYLKIDIDKALQTKINLGLISVEAITYSGVDVMHLMDIAHEQMKLINLHGCQERLKVENYFTPVLAYKEFSGVRIDEPKLYEHIRDAEAREWAALKKMRTHATINWSSSRQVIPILALHGIHEVNAKTGKPTCDLPALKKHLNKQIAVDLIEYSEAAKVVSSFGRRWLHFIQKDKRIHTRYKQFTSAGRTSCGALRKQKGDIGKAFSDRDIHYVEQRPFPNVQQVPRVGLLRSCFVPKKGNKFVKADYSSQESVIMADKTEDPAYLEFFRTGGGDIHSFTFRKAFTQYADLTDKQIKADHNELRTKIKSANFAIAYLGNGKTIAENLNIPISEGDALYNTIMGVFPTMPEFFKACYRFVLNYKYIPIDPVGGKRWISRIDEFLEKENDRPYWRRYYAEREENTEWYRNEAFKNKWFQAKKSEIRKEAVNSLIQGTGAYMSKLAGIYIFEYIKKNDLFGKVLIPIFVHDEWVTEQSEALTPKMAKVVHDCMVKAGTKALKNLGIKVDVDIVDSWAKT